MTSRSLLTGLVVLGACGGGVLYTTTNATPSAAPADAIACIKTNIGKLGYQLVAFDTTDPRIVAKKFDNTVNRPEPQFRHIINRIEAEGMPGADGKTQLKIVGHTVAEFSTQRGPTETEERASPTVTQDVQALAQACGQE
jgi:hypothetical protein